MEVSEEERIKQLQEDYKEKIEQYEESKAKIAEELKTTKGRDKEAVEYRMLCCQELIDDYKKKLNPTGKKEMYK